MYYVYGIVKVEKYNCNKGEYFVSDSHVTGGSRLSCTVVKPDSHLAQIFVAKFLCIIKLIIIIG